MSLVNIVDDNNNVADVDSLTKAINTINAEHNEIHLGNSYCAGYTVDIAGSASHYTILATPNTTRYLHLVFEIATEGETELSIYEDVTVATSLSGTALTARNRDRNSSNASSGLFYQGATPANVTLGSTRIYPIPCHWGTKSFEGGNNRAQNEIILKPNKKYAYVIKNASAAANYVGYVFNWYER
jgi:hypothetical protein